MIPYRKKILANGLTVVANRDRTSKLAAVNMLYKVGARNEDPARTGFAHLFEHLMFRGTKAVPDFDLPVQMASGDNNAFTNNDYTDFYITLPTANIETALWLESDRMGGLNITSEKLETEKKVVIEEYRQRYLNQPYGDQTLLLRALTYKVHPYRWAAIGLTPDHIAEATLADVETFYRAHYHPSNAILSISADLVEERMIDLAEKWFGELPDRPSAPAPIPQEPPQTEVRRQEVERDVPATTVTVAYPMGGRTSADFYTADLVSDSTTGWSRNDGCSRRSTPTSQATRTRDSSYSRGSCSRRRRPKRPKRRSGPRFRRSATRPHRTTRCKKSRTNSRQTPFSAN